MSPAKHSRHKRTVAIASGKGGVGKTVITANLALGLAQQFPEGSVVGVDLDLGCGNLNSCLGVRTPNGTINNFLQKKTSDLSSLLTPTERSNLRMISSSYSGTPEVALDYAQKRELVGSVNALEADFVLVDLGAGTSADVLDFFLGANEKIVVITPESLALHNAFVFLKTAIVHFLWRELDREGFLASVKTKLKEMLDEQTDLDIGRLIDRVRMWDRYAAYVLTGLIDEFKINIVVNMYRGGPEKAHLRRFHQLLFRYLHVRSNLRYLGFVHFDRGVQQSVQAVEPFLLRHPDNRAAKDFIQLAERFSNDKGLDDTPPLQFPRRFPSWVPEFLG